MHDDIKHKTFKCIIHLLQNRIFNCEKVPIQFVSVVIQTILIIQISIHGIVRLFPANFHVDNKFVLTAGLQDMKGTNGYTSWTSLPHFLYANRSLAEKYKMAPRKDEHGSFVS